MLTKPHMNIVELGCISSLPDTALFRGKSAKSQPLEEEAEIAHGTHGLHRIRSPFRVFRVFRGPKARWLDSSLRLLRLFAAISC